MGRNNANDDRNTCSDLQYSNKNMGPINFLSINVCGLKSKFNIPEFTELINSYDIIGFQETKLDDVDEINIDGYTVICQK